MRLLVATRSPHKIREIRRILAPLEEVEVVGPEEVGIPYDPAEEDLEPHATFEANAISKARYFHRRSGLPTVADDSGLEVDALDGAPGVRSKRFAPGEGLEGQARDDANNAYLIRQLASVPPEQRTARYVCVAALVDEGGAVHTLRGEAEGVIVDTPRGRGGFGYDPHFLDAETGKTFAELTAEEKNERSHRGEAFRALAALLRRKRKEE
ncbi:MAG: RdgB/HAM1 family non-canonical purine NTP pyrophosphatase [Gemmatimonadota bacterium]